MADTSERHRDLFDRPHESLGLELKQWIDPSTPEGAAKIAKGCLALRNSDGGRLAIGFTDAGDFDVENAPADVRAAFGGDAVQAVVSKYSAVPFAVEVQFVSHAGREFPVIVVPSGVRAPVAARADLRDADGKALIRDNAVYVRTLTSNNTVSSAEARRDDWEGITRTCFNNREADIGGFVRRHLAALSPGVLAALGPALAGSLARPTTADRTLAELDRGFGRFRAAAERRNWSPPDLGFRESATIIDGSFPPQAVDRQFLERMMRGLSRMGDSTLWIDFSGATDPLFRPNVVEGGWEQLDNSLDGRQAPFPPGLDFWRMEPRGVFYQARAIEDDLRVEQGLQPGQYLDFDLQVRHVAEVIDIGLTFGRSLGCDEAATEVEFGFRWTKLAGRRLVAWSNRERWLRGQPSSAQDTAVTSVRVPLDTPPSGISPHVENAVRGLFVVFEGREFESRVIANTVNRVLGLNR